MTTHEAAVAPRTGWTTRRTPGTTMTAVTFREFGGPEVLHPEPLAVPKIRPDEVLVQVAAVSVGRLLDLAARAGTHPYARFTFPHVLGAEHSGVIAAIGSDVTGLSLGQPVATFPVVTCGACATCLAGHDELCPSLQIIGTHRPGAYAEYVAVPATNVHPVPHGIDPVDACALALGAATAMNQLTRAGMRPGDWVVVQAAPSGLGSVTAALARHLGAHVVVTSRAAEKRALLRELGFEHVLDGTAADVAAAYVRAGYWEGRALGDHVREQADRTLARLALVDGDTRFTYADLVNRADAAATRLVRLGLRAGDRILVQLPNGWEFVVLTLACLRAGVVPVMALPGHRRHELGYLADHAQVNAIAVPDAYRGFDHQNLAFDLKREVKPLRHVLVTGEDVADDSVALRPLLAPSERLGPEREQWDTHQPTATDVAVFLLSGGTTGLPKLIARTHNDYSYNAKASGEISCFDSDTVYLVALPAGHNFPLACPGILGALMVGGRVVMLDSPEPTRAFQTIAQEGVTHTAAVPAVAQTWIDHQVQHGSDQLRSLRVLQVGGARLAEEIARKVKPVLGCTLQQVFGMAEGLLNYTRLDDPEDVIVGTQGRPISRADEVLLVDPFDQPVPEGESGSLLTRGPYTPRGYYRAAEHNSRSFTSDGWYRSGDICRWHPSGNLVVEGRDKDMINRGGEKISAEEVENLVYLLPEVDQVAAVAMPDAALGELVCIYVVGRPGAQLTLEQVRAALAAHEVAAYKLPDKLVVVDDLPSTNVGKIDKKALRADVVARLDREHTLSHGIQAGTSASTRSAS